VWPGALHAWLSSPKTILIGWGPETFSIAYARYRPASHNLTSEWELLYNKAHNEFLNVLTTTGLLGFLAYLYLLWSIIKLFTKYLSPNPSPTRRANGTFDQGEGNGRGEVVALFAGWSTLLVTNFWGFSVTITNTLLLLLPALAISLELESVRVEEFKLKKILIIISCSSTLLLFYSLGKYFMADIALAQSRNTTDPLTSYQQANLAYELNSTEPTILSELAYSAAYLAAALKDRDASLSAQFTDVAIQASDQSLYQSPQNPSMYRSKAKTLLLLSLIDKKYLDLAASALKIASYLAPTDPRLPAQLYQITSDEKYKSQTLLLKPDYIFP
jgi:hypothetical protein